MSGADSVRQCRAGSHHLYVHVPFCRLVCAYCDFVTVGGRGDAIPRYVAALHAELALRPTPGRLTTIYFGGGTPSLLPVRCGRGPDPGGTGPMGGQSRGDHPRGQPEPARGARLDRAAGGRRDADLAGRAVAARRRPAGAGARAFGSGGARGVPWRAGGRIRQREPGPDLRHPGPDAGQLARRAAARGCDAAGAPLALRARARPGARRVGRAPATRSAPLAPARGRPTGRRPGRCPVRRRRGAAGRGRLPPLRALVLGQARPRVTAQRVRTGIGGRTPAWEPARTRSTAGPDRGTSATWTVTWRRPRPGSDPVAGSERLDERDRGFRGDGAGPPSRRGNEPCRVRARVRLRSRWPASGRRCGSPRMPACWSSMPAGSASRPLAGCSPPRC